MTLANLRLTCLPTVITYLITIKDGRARTPKSGRLKDEVFAYFLVERILVLSILLVLFDACVF